MLRGAHVPASQEPGPVHVILPGIFCGAREAALEAARADKVPLAKYGDAFSADGDSQRPVGSQTGIGYEICQPDGRAAERNETASESIQY